MTKPSNSTPGVSAWAPNVSRPMGAAPDPATVRLLEELNADVRRQAGLT